MPAVTVGEVTISYEVAGHGEPVLMIPGTGARGRTYAVHQVPALVAAGYRVVTVDNRGVGGSGPARAGLTVGDLVADAAAVAEQVCGGPCRMIGSSLGAYVVQELLVAHPALATQAVLMASRACPDAVSLAVAAAERDLYDSGVELPPSFDAVTRALQNLSPATLQDAEAAQDWLDIFELSPPDRTDPGQRAQLDVVLDRDRRSAYRAISVPVLVMSFADDLVAPPGHGRELASAIPGARYAEIPAAGHYGYLEQPAAVNATILPFFRAPVFRAPVFRAS